MPISVLLVNDVQFFLEMPICFLLVNDVCRPSNERKLGMVGLWVFVIALMVQTWQVLLTTVDCVWRCYTNVVSLAIWRTHLMLHRVCWCHLLHTKSLEGFFSNKLKIVRFFFILEVFFDVMLNDLYSLRWLMTLVGLETGETLHLNLVDFKVWLGFKSPHLTMVQGELF